MDKNKQMREWLAKQKYLPAEFRDFHNQKDLFEAIHFVIGNANDNPNINQRTGHIYVVDTFLWYMAKRGYTLQRSRRKDLEFDSIEVDIKAVDEFTKKQFFSNVKQQQQGVIL